MKIISILRGLSIGKAASTANTERRLEWLRDPLAHPVIEAMSERELADLPFSRGPSRARAAEARCA